MKYRWPIFVVLSALVVAVLVLVVLNAGQVNTVAPQSTGLTRDGVPFDLRELRGAPLLVALHLPDCEPPCTSAHDTLSRLEQRLSVETERVFIGETGALVLGDRETLARLEEELGRGVELPARPGESDLLLASMDASGRPRWVRYVDSKDPAGTSASVDALLANIELLRSLGGRPLLHARLNGLSALILVLGLICIRRRWIRLHLSMMLLAALTTLGFLSSYLYYHAHTGSMPFQGQGWVRPLYFGVLLTHTVLAAFVAPLAVSLFYFAARRRFDRHRRIARWTLPLWLYVSITGVLIYLMLYIWFPG